jgi:hypothetical protein
VFRLCGFRLSAAVVLGELALPSQRALPHASGTRWGWHGSLLIRRAPRPDGPPDDPGGRRLSGGGGEAMALTHLPS